MSPVPPDRAAGPGPRLWLVAFGAAALAGACAPSGDDVVLVRGALGQPMGDYPSYEERVCLYATNRARVSPAAVNWPAYPAQPPMQWHYDLNRSARAHSIDMRDTPCFQHDSCDGTATFTRVLSFYTGPWMTVGENIAAGVMDPQTAVHNWINEIGAAAGETGHRDSIFSSRLTLIGCGFAPGGTSRTPNYWTQDFVGTAVTRPRLTDGIHFPKTVAAGGKVTFATTFYEAGATAAPQVFVVVDGACQGLASLRGTPALGAYEAAFTLADGCHPYYFVTTKGDGVAVATYPDAGALQVGVGGAAATCALYTATRAAATCNGTSGGTGAAGTTGGTGAAGTGATTGAAGTGATGAAGRTGGPGAAGTGGGTGAAGTFGTTGAAGTTGMTTGAAGTSATGSAGTTGMTTGAAGTGATGAAGDAAMPPGTGAAGSAGGAGEVSGSGIFGCDVSASGGRGGSLAAFTLAVALLLARRRRTVTSS